MKEVLIQESTEILVIWTGFHIHKYNQLPGYVRIS